ncbi:Homeodomain-interacting protein kinase 1, partial [Dissostichus eleginoides]
MHNYPLRVIGNGIAYNPAQIILCGPRSIRQNTDMKERTSERSDRLMFVDLLFKMLELDANNRITPVRKSLAELTVCELPASVSTEKPSTCQQSLSQPHYRNSCPSTSTETLGSAGEKRSDDESTAAVTSGCTGRLNYISYIKGYEMLASTAVRSPSQNRKADDMWAPSKRVWPHKPQVAAQIRELHLTGGVKGRWLIMTATKGQIMEARGSGKVMNLPTLPMLIREGSPQSTTHASSSPKTESQARTLGSAGKKSDDESTGKTSFKTVTSEQ